MKKHVVRKFFMNYEKEEKWLNEMAAKGLNLIHFSIGKYLFEEGTPGEYIYRIELLENMPSHAESQAYINFMEESGVECVDTYFRWVFFRKKAADGPFDLYSDYTSRIKHYKRVSTLVGVVGGVNLIVAFTNTMNSISYGSNFILSFSLLNWALALVLLSMLFSYLRKIFKLKKESQLYE